MKMLIISGIYPPDIGGPATYSKLISEELPNHGIETDLVVFSNLNKYPRIIRHFLFLLIILKKSKGVDFYYAQDPVSVGLPTFVASFLTRKKYILKIVGDYAWEQGSQKSNVKDTLDDFSVKNKGYGFFVYLLKKIQKTVAKHAYKIIVPSKYLKKIVSNWGIQDNKIFVIYNSFESDFILDDKEKTRRELGLNGKIIISVGRLVPWKGFDTLIKVVGEMTKDDNSINFLIVGDGPDREKLKKIIIDNNFINVKLIGRLDQNTLFRYLRASNAFILNTGYEGFSHQLLEVMAVGTPIITTKVGGNVELIEDDKNGVLVEYNDEKQIKDALIKVIKDKNFSDILVSSGLEKIKDFSKNKMIKDLLYLINNSKI